MILSVIIVFVDIIITYITCKRINYKSDKNEYFSSKIEMKEE